MVDPQITNCGHTFCKDCIAGIQRSNTNHCGICRAAVIISVTNLSLKKVIAELCKGCCIQCGNGMTLSDMGNHECPEELITYTACSEMYRRHGAYRHAQNCAERLINCSKCKKEMSASAIEE